MRCLLVALGLIASSCGALGQEFELPTLRGSDAWVPAPPAFGGWSGFYAGGQVGYTNVGSDFSNVSSVDFRRGIVTGFFESVSSVER